MFYSGFFVTPDGKPCLFSNEWTGELLSKGFVDAGGRHKDKILMQFTGILDKNGKEIYEGDIVKTALGNFVVTFSNGWYHAGGQRIDGISDIEVIGNVYEDYKLLSA